MGGMSPRTIHLLAVVLLIFSWRFTISFSHPQRKGTTVPYHMTSDVEEISGKSFDYIVVGGGAAGCPLAATLSEKFSVLVIERGASSPYQNPLVMEKKFYGFPLIQTDEYSSVAQSFVSEDGVSNLRGRSLGGSTAINGGFFSHASSDFVKKAGWDGEMVKEAYKWVESRVAFVPKLTPWQRTAELGFLEAGILPYNGFTLEHKEGTKIGGSIFDQFGIRHISADLLEAGNPHNLTVLLGATVKNIIFRHKDDIKDTPRAIGISFIKSDGSSDKSYEAYSNKRGEIILASGALGSPQILLLSGIGPSKHLSEFNISTVVDLKWVGQEMKDPPSIGLVADTQPQKRPTDPPQVVGIAHHLKFIVQALTLPITLNQTLMFVAAKYVHPASKGSLKLNSTNPRHNPTVKFNYLKKEKDLKQCVEMVKLLQRVVTSTSVSKFVGKQYNGDILTGKEELRKFCRENVRTFYHYHGGCTVGLVVDEDYKVYGVEGLRVVDGSTFVESPGTNPMATLMMLGRIQGLRMIREIKG